MSSPRASRQTLLSAQCTHRLPLPPPAGIIFRGDAGPLPPSHPTRPVIPRLLLLPLLALASLLAAPARAQDTVPRDTAPADSATAPRDSSRDTVRVRPSADARRRPDAVRRAATPRPRGQSRVAVADSALRGPRVCAGGDVTLGTNLDTTWVFTASARLGRRVSAFPDPDSLLAPLKPLLQGADVVMLNVEGAIGEGPPARRKCAPNSNTCFAFRSNVEAAGALRRVAGDAPFVGNVANNHARDAGEGGWYTTMRHLRDAGAAVTGADTLATPVVTPRGDTVAFLGFSPWTGPDPRNLAAVRRHVARAAARYRYVVVSVHIGAEGRGAQHTYDATEIFLGEDRGNSVAFAHAAIDAGAGVVFGSGPHVMRAAEWYRGGLIFYSLGNLLTYGPFTLSEPMNRGAVACADLQPAGGVLAAELRSTRQAPPGVVRADSAGTAASLVDALSAQDFPASAGRVTMAGALQRPGVGEAGGTPAATGPLRRP
jgi:capsule synthesis protein PGA_cap